MPDLRVPEYLQQRMAQLRTEQLRIAGALAELEAMSRSLTTVSPPEMEVKRAKGKRGNDTRS